LSGRASHSAVAQQEGDYGQFLLAGLMRHAGLKAPTVLLQKKDQGRRAAVDLLANSNEPLQRVFDKLPENEKVRQCAAKKP
jgi:hypothetical protein